MSMEEDMKRNGNGNVSDEELNSDDDISLEEQHKYVGLEVSRQTLGPLARLCSFARFVHSLAPFIRSPRSFACCRSTTKNWHPRCLLAEANKIVADAAPIDDSGKSFFDMSEKDIDKLPVAEFVKKVAEVFSEHHGSIGIDIDVRNVVYRPIAGEDRILFGYSPVKNIESFFNARFATIMKAVQQKQNKVCAPPF